MTKLVTCKKYGENLAALSDPPFLGPLGTYIAENISEKAWGEWFEHQMKILNEERLDLSELASQDRIFDEMKKFLNINDLG